MLVLTILMIAALLPVTSFGMPAGSASSQANTVSQPSGSSTKENDSSPKTSGSSGWQHPGFVVSKSQLDFVKTQVVAKAEPWSSALSKMLQDEDKYGKYVSTTRSSKAQATVKCGPTTNPDIGCTDERGDALAAWANALAGYVSGDENHTKNAISLMNKWSSMIKGKLPFSYYATYMRDANIFARSLTGQRNLANSMGRSLLGKSWRASQTYHQRSLERCRYCCV